MLESRPAVEFNFLLRPDIAAWAFPVPKVLPIT
jgi:hypothetical protein